MRKKRRSKRTAVKDGRASQNIKAPDLSPLPKIHSKDTGLFVTHFPSNLSGLLHLVAIEWAHHPKGFLPCIGNYRRQALKTLVASGIYTKKEVHRFPDAHIMNVDFEKLQKHPAGANAYVLVHLIEHLRNLMSETVSPVLGAIGRAWYDCLIKDSRNAHPEKASQIDGMQKHAPIPESTAVRRGKDLMLEVLGLALGIGEVGQQLAVRSREVFAKGGSGRLGALPRATKASVAGRQERAADKKQERARRMRRYIESGQYGRSSAALLLSTQDRELGSYSSFYRSLDK